MATVSTNAYTPVPRPAQSEPDPDDQNAEERGPEPMDDATFEGVMHTLVTDAVQFVDSELTPARTKAAEYYAGEPFGDEQKGRSQFVMTTVRDTLLAMMPDLLRVFLGADRAVEYTPWDENDVEGAAQRTDYVNEIVLSQDNPGFQIFHDWFHDALLKRLGIVKWGWDDAMQTRTYRADNVPGPQLEELALDPAIELITVEPLPWQVEHEGRAAPAFRCEYKQTRRDGRARVWCVPPEEFIFSRRSRDIDETALFVGHRTEKTRSELLAMGVPETVIDEFGGNDASLDDSAEEVARRPDEAGGEVETGDEATERHLYVEGYVYVDRDGDGTAELRRVLMIGPSYHPFQDEPWDERPFAVLCPFPVPHAVVGQSLADLTMDLQRTESKLWRAMLDSLALSIFPRTWYVEGKVSSADILNTQIGAPVRMDAPQMAGEFTHQFQGRDAMPVLEALNGVKEDRTGISRASAGLDPDALQSSTKAAVAATISKAQARTEMIARIFAETGVKRLFKGLARLFVAYQPSERVVRLRGKWVTVDPRSWDADQDVTINVALGNGLIDEQLATLEAIAAKQEQVLQTMGLQNPLVTLGQYGHTLARMINLRGEKDTSRYLNPLPADWQPPQQPEPPPDPAMLVAQAEVQKAQAEVAKKQAEIAARERELEMIRERRDMELAAERHKTELEDDRERDKLEADIALRTAELEAKYQIEIDTARIRADMERDREQIRARAAVRPKRKIMMKRDEATGDLTLAEDTIEETA